MMGKTDREKFESFDKETKALLNDNNNGKNNEVLRQRMRTRAIMTYTHNLGYYYEQNPFGNELFYIDAWIDQNKNWLESSKVFIYYGANELTSNEDYTQFTIKVNGQQKIVGRVEDYYVTHSRDDNERSLMLRKNYFQQLAYVQYLEERRLELTQPEPEPLDLSDTTAVEKIIYLNELGIIDFLRTKPEFIGSTNLMATFLSAITDVKASTLQTSLNRLINNDTEDKNHPYRTKNTVEKVRQTLVNKNVNPKTS